MTEIRYLAGIGAKHVSGGNEHLIVRTCVGTVCYVSEQFSVCAYSALTDFMRYGLAVADADLRYKRNNLALFELGGVIHVLDKNDNPYRVIEKQTKYERYVYDINPARIGNLAAVYPTVEDDPARSERILAQNSDAKLDLLFGYSLIGAGQDLAPMEKITADSKAAYDKIIAAKTEAELDAAIAEMNAMLESAEAKAALENIGAYYLKWLTEKGIVAAA